MFKKLLLGLGVAGFLAAWSVAIVNAQWFNTTDGFGANDTTDIVGVGNVDQWGNLIEVIKKKMIENLKLIRRMYADYLYHKVRKEKALWKSVTRFILLVATFPISFFLMVALIHLANSIEKEFFDELRKQKDDWRKEGVR